MKNEEAYLHFLHALKREGEGVFWSRYINGENQWAFSVGVPNSVPFESEKYPLFTVKNFQGDEGHCWNFDECYSNVLGVFPNEKGLKIPSPRKILENPLASYAKEKKSDFCEKVRHVQSLQRKGEMWVLNLSHNMKGTENDPQGFLNNFFFFLQSKRKHIGGVVWTNDLKFISFSPETFLIEKRGIITTYPIKGTGTKKDLENSMKEKSELSMITDLMRNDLSQIGTNICVNKKREITDEVDFYHSYSEISAELIHNYMTESDFKKLLPAGSISGAPKKRVVEEIIEQESYLRDYYTGTFGVRFHKEFSLFNILIRTVFFSSDMNKWMYPVGAGITVDSVPEREWEETLKKAEILKRFFSGLTDI